MSTAIFKFKYVFIFYKRFKIKNYVIFFLQFAFSFYEIENHL